MTVTCPICKWKVFDNLVVKALIIRIDEYGAAECRCKRCKGEHWIKLPLVYKTLQVE